MILKKLLLLLSLVCVQALPAYATLGEQATLPADDGKRMLKSETATSKSETPASYTVRETRTEYGLVVREFMDADGVVFAVAWRGPVRPDMRELLGRYFARFADAPLNSPTGPLVIRDDDLMLQSAGHMGDFFGRAWLPSLLPEDVDVGELQ